MMKLFIKNMVCPRCILSVQEIFKNAKVEVKNVSLGEVEIEEKNFSKKSKEIKASLQAVGFELLDDPTAQLITKIKSLLIQQVQSGLEEHFSIQKFLKSKIFKDYSSLSKLFSEVEGITIEQFFLLQKIEKAKELIIYNEMPLFDIANSLGYSSGQHLSSQFKRITGMTPTQFKAIGNKGRKSIDNLN